MDKPVKKTIYVLSDATGETATLLLKAALVQFKQDDINFFRYKNVRNKDQLLSILDHLPDSSGLLVHTMVSKSLRKTITEESRLRGLLTVDLLGPTLHALEYYFEKKSDSEEGPGQLRTVDETYFKKIEAIEYTVKYDDGKCLDRLDQAVIVLVGISRTSKTPLSIYLSYKGLKVANIPMVVDQPLPEELFKIDQKKIVGLSIELEALRRIRKKRLEKFGQDPEGNYASLKNVSAEITFSEKIFSQNRRWPVINVTDRALEETASEIARVVSSRLGLKKNFFF
jgi:regulator of PEP synthase PpsR (kinase-PPPase family)